MPNSNLDVALLGGRLAIDFANFPSFPASGQSKSLTWKELIRFLQATRIVSSERADELLDLSDSDPVSVDDLLNRAQRLRDSLRLVLVALAGKTRVLSEWVLPINEVLQVTEGHDELVETGRIWRIEYLAREDGLDWLLAAIARSAAELITQGHTAEVRLCANPGCSLFFLDSSRTHRRRWCSMALCGNRHKVAAFARRHSLKKRAAGAGA
jgi:predicted RNA-binding Zn ribbon-like protein